MSGKKAAVIRRSQQPASAVQHQAATTTTDQHASEQLSELSSTLITSKPVVPSNPFVQFRQLTTSHVDQQQTTNPFTTTSQISQETPFQPTHSSNPFAPLNQSTSSPASTTNPFEMTDFPIIQLASSPSVFQQTFNYPEPITPTCSSPIPFDTPERPLHRRPIPDRKIDGIFQRLSTLEKNQTEIKKTTSKLS
ncbi:unnamed protein product [Mytilus coruscus]|uniref:Uncharacterized protein n=1 Tax=Mytilus coruscus TaxID=42192 RepID=A0A6J8EUU5_MYTCO|nr:unnamed protein product [Mytilus coruscus]